MEFGLFFLMQRDEAWTEHEVYVSGLEQMLAAEALGYTSVWIAEHHFNDYGLCPSPPVLASFVAARTTTLRLGMGVSLLPLHHPVDLAEQLAVLDVVSEGRLDVGIGRGGTLQDYQTFQSDRGDSRARVEEGIALMRESWGGAPFDFRGRFHSAERLHVRPRPTQRPHPPLFIAANSEDSVLSAARLGLPTLSSFFVPVGELQKRHQVYREAGLAADRPLSEVEELERRSWGMRVVHVAPDRGAAGHRGALHGLSAAHVDPALGLHGRICARLLRPLLAAPAGVPRVSGRRVGARGHARRSEGRPPEVPGGHRL